MQSTSSKNLIEAKANLKDLQPRDRNKILEAKVYRAWIAREPPSTIQKGFRAILLDKQVNSTYNQHSVSILFYATKYL